MTITSASENYLTKLARVLSARTGVRVVLREGAVPSTDGREITLPSLSDERLEAVTKHYEKRGISGMDVLHGMTDHETSHGIYTFTPTFDAAALKATTNAEAAKLIKVLTSHGAKPGHLAVVAEILFAFFNVGEDIRCETLWTERFPGAAALFFSLYLDEVLNPVDKKGEEKKSVEETVGGRLFRLILLFFATHGAAWQRQALSERKTPPPVPTARETELLGMLSNGQIMACPGPVEVLKLVVPMTTEFLKDAFEEAKKREEEREKERQKKAAQQKQNKGAPGMTGAGSGKGPKGEKGSKGEKGGTGEKDEEDEEDEKDESKPKARRKATASKNEPDEEDEPEPEEGDEGDESEKEDGDEDEGDENGEGSAPETAEKAASERQERAGGAEGAEDGQDEGPEELNPERLLKVVREVLEALSKDARFREAVRVAMKSVPPERLSGDPLRQWKTLTTEQDRTFQVPAASPYRTDEFKAEATKVSLGHLGRHLLGEFSRRYTPAPEGPRLNQRHLASFATPFPALDVAFLATASKKMRKNIAVELIVDCSGSMRGQKLHNAMLAAGALSFLLDKLNIPFAAYGFTTGGNLSGDYASHGPYTRVEALVHPIFKPFNMPFRTAVASFANYETLSTANNIDGESIATLSTHLLARPEKRKILIILSDGLPRGNTSAQALSNHLKAVVEKLEKIPGLEVYAVGLKGIGYYSDGGDAVKDFYSRYVVLTNFDELPNLMLQLFMKGPAKKKIA